MKGVMDPQALFSITLSLKVATTATLAVTLTGIPLAYLLARKDFPGKHLLDALVTLPLIFPPTVTGYLLLLLLGRRGPVGNLLYRLGGISILFTWYAAVVASGVAALPLMVKSAKAAMEAVDPRLIMASYTLGKGERATFFRVILPLARGGIVAGIVVAFARAMGEFGATLMLAGNIPFKTNTIPLEIYSAVSSARFYRANLLVVVTTFISLGVIYTVNRLGHRRPPW